MIKNVNLVIKISTRVFWDGGNELRRGVIMMSYIRCCCAGRHEEVCPLALKEDEDAGWNSGTLTLSCTVEAITLDELAMIF